MFAQSPTKVETNRLRRMLIEKGHSVRSAAREMGISASHFCALLSSYDQGEAFAEKVEQLPKRDPAKMKTVRRATKRGTPKTKKATA
ncbi:MAG: hypothetical protein ACQKBU_07850 [Verrucomicrobiales bacterium]